MRLVGLFFLNPEATYSLAEIIERLEGVVAWRAALRETERLVEAGYVIKHDPNSRRARYQANHRCYIFDELHKIAVKTFGGHGKLVDAIQDDPNVLRAAIFGSFVKGTPTADSDLDILLAVVNAEEPAFFDLMGHMDQIGGELGREINAKTYPETEVVERLTDASSLVYDVFSGPILPLKGAFDDWQSIVASGSARYPPTSERSPGKLGRGQ